MIEKIYHNNGIKLKYYEVQSKRKPLVLIHAQGVNGKSFANVAKRLSGHFHLFSVDCYGHGGSLHQPDAYNIRSIGDAIIDFIRNVIGQKIHLLGHSSGGLIAAYIAAETDLCDKLILEDPPFFASQGERRKKTFHYIDLSMICHRYITEKVPEDFVLYYFKNQYVWSFFPEQSGEKIKEKLTKTAAVYRRRYPDKDLRVPFWSKAALAGFQGLQYYDPLFGDAFYTDSFHCGIPHEELLKKISCRTVFMKAKTQTAADGILMAALNDEDVRHVVDLIGNCRIIHFDCGHGIHIEKPGAFVRCLTEGESEIHDIQ